MNHNENFIKVENTRKYKIKVRELNNTTAELKKNYGKCSKTD